MTIPSSQNDVSKNTAYGTALIHEPAEVYHQKSKHFLSSHALGDFRKCPLLYHKKQQGLIEDEDRPAYLVGSALHTLVLEGRDRFEQEYAVGGPVNPKTGEIYGASTKAFAEWAEAQGRPVLTLAQLDLIENMADGRAGAPDGHGIALLRRRRGRRADRVPRCPLPVAD